MIIVLVFVFLISLLYLITFENFAIGNDNVAYVSGYIGPENVGGYATARIPRKVKAVDCYFVTNLPDVARSAKEKGWIPRLIDSPTDQSYMGCTMACKRLKVFPQSFIQGKRKFVIWFDNKLDIRSNDVDKVLANWNSSTAVAMHRHPYLSNTQGEGNLQQEFDASMLQERYRLQKQQYLHYMDEERRLGYAVENQRHFTCCFIIYNLHHSAIPHFQNTWWEHIQRCGIQDQISMYFVAQRFPIALQEFEGGGRCGG